MLIVKRGGGFIVRKQEREARVGTLRAMALKSIKLQQKATLAPFSSSSSSLKMG